VGDQVPARVPPADYTEPVGEDDPVPPPPQVPPVHVLPKKEGSEDLPFQGHRLLPCGGVPFLALGNQVQQAAVFVFAHLLQDHDLVETGRDALKTAPLGSRVFGQPRGLGGEHIRTGGDLRQAPHLVQLFPDLPFAGGHEVPPPAPQPVAFSQEDIPAVPPSTEQGQVVPFRREGGETQLHGFQGLVGGNRQGLGQKAGYPEAVGLLGPLVLQDYDRRVDHGLSEEPLGLFEAPLLPRNCVGPGRFKGSRS
jgi:hypothetical protein